MRIAAAVMALLITTAVLADVAEDVRQHEIAFAKAFADRDKEKFFSYVADDATFLGGLSTQRGKAQVVERWSRFFTGAQAPFSWIPDRVAVSADGTLGFTSGPVFAPDGKHAGSFQSTWRKQADGSWKVLFDGSGPGAAVMPEDVVPMEEGSVTTPDGVKLHYRKTGAGPVTMIVPLGYILHDPMKQFADIATVVTYDLRNRGRSGRSDNKDTWTIEQDVEDLETIRRHLKVEQFVPVGFSYLGKMVILYASKYPQHVPRVIQLGPAPNGVLVRAMAQDFGAPKELMERVAKMRAEGAAAKSPREFCLAFWEMMSYYMVGDPKNAARYDVATSCAHDNELSPNLLPVIERVMASSDKAALTSEELSKIKIPVLTIHGTKDRNAPYEAGRSWAEQLPNARLVALPGAAHAMWIDAPEVTYSAIRSFLRGDWPLESVSAKR
ncbi:MAG TPA: alpha/beta fold hydrolase [Thermoanaerobaculia bacterium]|nr:alpha/beta fold hydrolase [Thermoanaerobaculia bacterium]